MLFRLLIFKSCWNQCSSAVRMSLTLIEDTQSGRLAYAINTLVSLILKVVSLITPASVALTIYMPDTVVHTECMCAVYP